MCYGTCKFVSPVYHVSYSGNQLCVSTIHPPPPLLPSLPPPSSSPPPLLPSSPPSSSPPFLQCITFPFDLLIKGVVNGNHLVGVDILKDILGIVSWMFVVVMLVAYR